MNSALRMAMVGVGRIGVHHARRIQELGQSTGACELTAIVDNFQDNAHRVAELLQPSQATEIATFTDVSDLAAAGLTEAAMIASRTDDHHRDALTLIDAGHRVLLEKPLTGSVASAAEFVDYLNADARRSQALMIAFMRRFDRPLLSAKRLLESGRIGRPFKFVSVLEDPVPPPDGYNSPGLLIDMSVHNIDEIMWLLGKAPRSVMSLGANLYNYTITPVVEDLDDAQLNMWFPDGVIGQVQVSRNHAAGYRNETWAFGEAGCIHVGHFQEDPLSVAVEAYGPNGLIERETFALKDYGDDVPVFIKRFGEAYAAELADFVQCCRNNAPFRVTHDDGLRAMRVAEAGSKSIRTEADAASVEYE